MRFPVFLNRSPRNPPAAAQQSAMTPPAIPVITSATINCEGPIQAPMAAHNFTSPMPIPPIAPKMPKSRAPSPRPARLCPSPCQPCCQAETAIPEAINGNTSQFGIRRLRRSVKVATARTITVGHHAIECIPIPQFRISNGNKAIFHPNLAMAEKTLFQEITQPASHTCVHACLHCVLQSEAEDIHPYATSAFSINTMRPSRNRDRESVIGNSHLWQPYSK